MRQIDGLTLETDVLRDKIRMLRDSNMTHDVRRLMFDLADLVNKLSNKVDQLSEQQTGI